MFDDWLNTNRPMSAFQKKHNTEKLIMKNINLTVLFTFTALISLSCNKPVEHVSSEDTKNISLETPELKASFVRQGYVSGVKGSSFIDKKTGARDQGFGLDIIDWIMEPGADDAYKDKLTGDLAYDYNNLMHGKRAKKSIEGPQICTQAKELDHKVVHAHDFTTVYTNYKYHLAAPGKKAGSLWEQTLVFPRGKRYFISSDRITSTNESQAMFLRLDMPGHIKRTNMKNVSEIYLSYIKGNRRIPISEFDKPFAPDEKFNFRRDRDGVPERFIRAYRVNDPKTGKPGPWLAGMTLDPNVVHEGWCNRRPGFICLIEEFGGRPIRAGEQFSAAFIVGWFDSIEEMHRVYDKHKGSTDVYLSANKWLLK